MSGSDRKLRVWTTGAMTRIFPNDAPPGGPVQAVELRAARGQTACFQIGVRTEGFRIEYLRSEAADLEGLSGVVIPAECVECLYAEYVPVKWAAADQAPGDVEREPPAFFPDPLLPELDVVTAGAVSPPTRSVWVRLLVPRDQAAGPYRGRIAVKAGCRAEASENAPAGEKVELSATVEFQLTVWDFDMPENPSLLLSVWMNPNHIAKWYRVRQWGDEHFRLIEMFAADMAAHRQNVILTPVMSLIRAGAGDGGYVFDFSLFDRWCELFLARGFRLIEGGHVGYKERVVHVGGEHGRRDVVELGGVDDPAHREFFTAFFRALWDHLGEKGWRDRYIQHISDEPNEAEVPKYRRMRELIREAAPGMKTIDALNEPGFADATDIPVPIENMYDELIAQSGRSPEDVWVYYCCGPTGRWPNRFIDYTLVRVRIFSWLCFAKGIPGFLHWGYNQWGTNPRNRKEVLNPWDDTTAHRWPGGDPQVVYPPRDEMMTRDKVIGSIRWEIIREAMEDYEYLRMTRELAEGGNAEAKAILEEIAAKVVPDWTTHTRDHEYLVSVRDRMGNLISGTAQ